MVERSDLVTGDKTKFSGVNDNEKLYRTGILLF